MFRQDGRELRHEHESRRPAAVLIVGGLAVAAELPAHVQEPVVDVLPLKPESLAEPETGEDQGCDQRPKLASLLEQPRDLGVVEDALLMLGARPAARSARDRLPGSPGSDRAASPSRDHPERQTTPDIVQPSSRSPLRADEAPVDLLELDAPRHLGDQARDVVGRDVGELPVSESREKMRVERPPEVRERGRAAGQARVDGLGELAEGASVVADRLAARELADDVSASRLGVLEAALDDRNTCRPSLVAVGDLIAARDAPVDAGRLCLCAPLGIHASLPSVLGM